jgi:hypothetical protein
VPCTYDEPEPDARQIYLSQALCALDELDGKKFDPAWWRNGCYPRAGTMSATEANNLVANLCSRLQDIESSFLSNYSLELQMWWRDHQKDDTKRIREEILKHKQDADRRAALAKLTPYERKLLGFNQGPWEKLLGL